MTKTIVRDKELIVVSRLEDLIVRFAALILLNKTVNYEVICVYENTDTNADTISKTLAYPHAIDLDKYNIAGSIKSRICVKGSCAGCNLKRECAYRKFCNNVDHASGLDFQVTNHNMYLMSQKTRNDEHPPLLRSSAFIVIDEAHKFKEAAEDTFGERISEKDIENYVTAVALLCSPVFNKDKYKEHLVEAVKENKALFASFRIKRNPNDVDEGRGSIISLTTFQCGKLAKLIHIIERIENMKVKQNHGISVTGKLLITAMTAINKTGKNTIWLDTDENGVLSLCSTPKNIDSILFASGSMWEGVDCVGDCLSSVIIVRLPFPMRSALMEEKKVTCRNMTEFVDKHCTPNMLIKLRQGVGRLIRCETDTGLISILDPRAKSKAYCSKVFAAIDKYPLIESTKEIEDFFKLVKNAKYFE